VVVDGPGGRLRGASVAAPPIRAIETRKVANVKPLREGLAVYDLGQNASMMSLLKVSGPAGAVVRITPAELLHGRSHFVRRRRRRGVLAIHFGRGR
jgi:alpha-L-rhamnosidase